MTFFMPVPFQLEQININIGDRSLFLGWGNGTLPGFSPWWHSWVAYLKDVNISPPADWALRFTLSDPRARMNIFPDGRAQIKMSFGDT